MATFSRIPRGLPIPASSVPAPSFFLRTSREMVDFFLG